MTVSPAIFDSMPETSASPLINDVIRERARAGLLPVGRTSYSCPGCDAWQVDTVLAPDTTMREIEAILRAHADACPPLAMLIAEAGL